MSIKKVMNLKEEIKLQNKSSMILLIISGLITHSSINAETYRANSSTP
jgi:hypothetical protein